MAVLLGLITGSYVNLKLVAFCELRPPDFF